jgi:hypothetical protein
VKFYYFNKILGCPKTRLSFLFPVAISVSLHYSSNKGRRKKKQKENREATYSATFS